MAAAEAAAAEAAEAEAAEAEAAAAEEAAAADTAGLSAAEEAAVAEKVAAEKAAPAGLLPKDRLKGGAVAKEELLALGLSPDYRHECGICDRDHMLRRGCPCCRDGEAMGLVVGWPRRRMGQQMVGAVARGLSLFGGASSEVRRCSKLQLSTGIKKTEISAALSVS